MGIILFIIGLLFSADGFYCAVTTHMGAGEAIVIAIGIAFMLWGVFHTATKEKIVLRIFKVLFVIFMSVYIVYSFAICIFGHLDTTTYTEDYVIVLGAGLDGAEPSQILKERLDKTVSYMNRNENAVAVVSGGAGKHEIVTEAYAMEMYLVEHGIDEERIIQEENAASTYENFQYSKAALEDGSSVVFITSAYHVPRSMQMAKISGIDATHIGASVPLVTVPTTCAREMAAQIAAFRYY